MNLCVKILYFAIISGSRAICSCADGFFESANVDDLERHLAGHASRVYACRYCGKENTRPHYLKIHIRTHTGGKLLLNVV